MKYQTAVLIGRFQPFHTGHAHLFGQALDNAEKLVVVLGSACSARSTRNPFWPRERQELIQQNLDEQQRVRVHFVEVRDYYYNNAAWINEVLQKVSAVSSGRTALFGFEKDKTSIYLKWFPDWEIALSETPEGAPEANKTLNFDVSQHCSATPVRERFLRDPNLLDAEATLSEATKAWLQKFASENPAYKYLHEEQRALDNYKASWAESPYPPIFVTTDALVIQAGHVLLIERKDSPGKGLWAMPGGFLEHDEFITTCAVRELFEETSFAMPAEELLANLKEVKIFDHPLRSARGRTIAHVHCFQLPGQRLTPVNASDDAAKAKWVPILDVAKMEDQFFEDHFYILKDFMSRF